VLSVHRTSTQMGSRFCVSSLKRVRSGAFNARKRLPADVRLKYQALYGPAWEVKLTLPAGTSPEKAKALHAAWLAEVEGRIATLRAGYGCKAQDLSQREADALAGDWYRSFTTQHLDNPGSPHHWHELRETLLDIAGNPETGEVDFDEAEVLAAVAIEARTAVFLTDRGLTLSKAAQSLFLAAVAREFLHAAKTLEQRARGDWSYDQHLDQLAPAHDGTRRHVEGSLVPSQARMQTPARSASHSAVTLFEAYCQDRRRAASTINRWRGVFNTLEALALDEAITDPEGAQRWLDCLIGSGTPPRGHRTVKDISLSAARTVYAWAVRKRLVPANPFEGCTIDVPRTIQTRETEKEFTEAEAKTILRASLLVEVPPEGARGSEWAAAKRWVPWLCAYTGARVGELTQCRAGDVECRPSDPKGPFEGAEYPVLRITPEAGTVKTGKGPHSPYPSPFGRDGSAPLRRDG